MSMHVLGSTCSFFFSSRRRHTRWPRDWSSDVCSSDLAKVYGTDISRKALQVAEMNAEQLGSEVHFRHGNFLQPFLMSKQKVEIIISNPPYISYKEKSE